MTPQRSLWRTLVVPFLIGMLILSGYLIFKNNPEIMNQESYYRILTKNENDHAIEKRVVNTELAADVFVPLPATPPLRRGHRLVPMSDDKFKPIILTSSQVEWVSAGQNIIVKGDNSLLVTNVSGEVQWEFKLSDKETFSPGGIATSGYGFFVSTTNGRVYAFDIRSGDLIWYKNTEQKLFYSPLVSEDFVITFNEIKAGQLWGADILDLKTGSTLKRFDKFEMPLSGTPKVKSSTLYFATQTGRLNAVNLTSNELTWKSDGTSSFMSGPTFLNDRVFVLNEDGVAVGFDKKNGRKIVEIDLASIANENFQTAENGAYSFTVDTKGYLVAVDLRAAKKLWQYNLNTSRKKPFYLVTRLSVASMNRLSFASEANDWTVWASCSETRICIFDVKTGRLLHRIDLKGVLAGQFAHLDNFDRLLVPIRTSDQIRMIGFEVPAASPSSANVDKQTSGP